MRTALIDYLKKEVPELSFQDQEKILAAFKEKKVEKNNFLVLKGEKHVPLYFVAKGLLRFFDTFQDKERTFDLVKENCLNTVVPDFIRPTSSSTSYIETLEDAHLYYISYNDFKQICQEITALHCWYSCFLEEWVLRTSCRLDAYHNDMIPLQQRYQLLLEDPYFSADFRKRLSEKMIASFLWVTPEAFSRMKKNL